MSGAKTAKKRLLWIVWTDRYYHSKSRWMELCNIWERTPFVRIPWEYL